MADAINKGKKDGVQNLNLPKTSVAILEVLSKSKRAMAPREIAIALASRDFACNEDTVVYFLHYLLEGSYARSEGLVITKAPTEKERGLAETVYAATQAGTIALDKSGLHPLLDHELAGYLDALFRRTDEAIEREQDESRARLLRSLMDLKLDRREYLRLQREFDRATLRLDTSYRPGQKYWGGCEAP